MNIETHDLARQRGLARQQRQLIEEMRVLNGHPQELNSEIERIVDGSREGRVPRSISAIGPIQAGTIIAAIGHIDNFSSAAARRAYCGWAPQVVRLGTTLDQVHLTRGGTRTLKGLFFVMVGNAI